MSDKHEGDLPQGHAVGGKARAEKLTPEQRKEIAKKASAARWNSHGPILKATHSGALTLGSMRVECAVLEDGSRVISQRGFARAMGASTPTAINRRGSGNLPVLLTAQNLNAFIDDELKNSAKPLAYRMEQGGRSGYGIRAEAIPKICDVWLKARDNGVLRHNQIHLAKAADILIRGLAHVGIVALVDEATGYQKDRPAEALARILEAFIAKELQPWVRTFPTDYYQELFRLRGLQYPHDSVLRPQYFGVLTNDIVYKRLAPGVLAELKKAIPRNDTGRPKAKLFQKLTNNIGYPKLREHLGAVVAVMKLSVDYGDFIGKMDRMYPRFGETLMLPLNYEDTSDDGKGL
jgi:hypothetical protein